MEEIIIATRNAGKVKEFQVLFSKYKIKVTSLLDLEDDLPEVEETGNSFEENAALKAEQISSILKRPVLADDSGLMVDALNGDPGIYSARYAGEGKSDGANNKKILGEMQNIPAERRMAKFVCVLAIAAPGEETVFYKGHCEGRIAFSPSGVHGFGYDPIFIPKGYQKTMAELSPEEKNQISHRRNAIQQLEVSMLEKL